LNPASTSPAMNQINIGIRHQAQRRLRLRNGLGALKLLPSMSEPSLALGLVPASNGHFVAFWRHGLFLKESLAIAYAAYVCSTSCVAEIDKNYDLVMNTLHAKEGAAYPETERGRPSRKLTPRKVTRSMF